MKFFILLAASLISANALATIPFVGTGDIKNGSVTNAKLATMTNSTIKCNISGGSASPTDCTGGQIGTVVGALIGTNNLSDVPSPAAARANLGITTIPTLANSSVVFTDPSGKLTSGYFTGGASLSGSTVTLGNPGASQKGGVISDPCITHNFATGVQTTGDQTCAQPAFTDLTGAATAAQMLALANGSVYVGNGSNQPSAMAQAPAGAVITSNGSAWNGSVIAAPACVAISASNVDWSQGNCFTKSLSANTTLTFSNRVAGQTILLRITNPAVYTLTFPNTNTPGASVLWPGSTIPAQSTGNHSDIFTVFFDGTNMFGNPTQNF